MESISAKDRAVLRALAQKQLEYANSERNREIIRLWYKHNACEGERPLSCFWILFCWDEIVTKRLTCEGDTARMLESAIYGQFLNAELFGDDTPVDDFYPVLTGAHIVPFGINVEIERAPGNEAGLAYHFKHPIKNLYEDYHLLGDSIIGHDAEWPRQVFNLAGDVFSGIMEPKYVMNSVFAAPTSAILQMMSMETMFTSMYDYPELFHEMLRRFTDDMKRLFRYMEDRRLLLPTAGSEYLAQGSRCFTRELPDKAGAEGLSVRDVWGFLDSQETVGLSPTMFDEFIFPYYKELADEYGLLSYGCCEPVHPFWDGSLCKFGNLRKLSISNWCDEEFIGERLRGRKVVYLRKPSPNLLGVNAALDEDEVRRHIRKTLDAAAGLTLELSMVDVYTIHNDEGKVRRYIDIVRQTVDRYWKP